MGELMKIKSIKEWQKKSAGEMIKFYLTSTWYFESARDKIILFVMGILAMWKIAGWIF